MPGGINFRALSILVSLNAPGAVRQSVGTHCYILHVIALYELIRA